MRLLRIVCSGYPLFKESETIDLIASQKVTEEDRLKLEVFFYDERLMEYLHPENYIQMYLNEKYADRRMASFVLK